MTVQAAYLAGIMDGEGSIMLIRTGNAQMDGMYTSWTIKVSIANTNLLLLTTLQHHFGGMIKRTTGKVVDAATNWKIGYRLQWHAAEAASIIALISDHLIIKREQADIAIAALTLRNSEGGKGRKKSLATVLALNDYSNQVKFLNKRGLA